MRRFASVFRSKHSDRSDSNHALSIVPPVLSPASDHRSSGSSTASSLRTPEDIPSRTTPRSPWLSWLGAKKHKPWQQPQQTHTNVVSTQSHETEDDSADDSDHDSVSPSESTTAIPPIPVHNLTSKPILHSLSPSPFHHLTGTLFPRSCNHPRSLPPPHTMRSAMLKSHLYRCIQSGLTSPDNFPIMSLQSSTPQSDLDDPAITDPLQLTPISHGLRRWISRPCFEDRSVVWVHVLGSDEVICQRVTGSSLGVAELEYSDAIDSLAGYTGDSLEPLSQSELPQVVLVPHEDTREPEPEPEPNGSLSGEILFLSLATHIDFLSSLLSRPKCTL
jgi:hypothetical protein